MSPILTVAAWALLVLVARWAVMVALRRAVAWEERCRDARRDREWAEVEPRWSGRG